MNGTSSPPVNIARLIRPARRHLRSPSNRLAFCVGLLTYLCYAFAHGAWTNTSLLLVSALFAVLLPTYSRWSNRIEDRVAYWIGFMSVGRSARFLPQYLFNLAAFAALYLGGALDRDGLSAVGGFAVAALVTTLASQGAQYAGLWLFQRGVGDTNRNVLVGLSVNIALTSLGTAGVPVVREVFLFGGLLLGALVFGVCLLSDLRSVLYPRRGVGILLGTFNPFHDSHLAMVRAALMQRRLRKVYVHPTGIPRFHRQSLARGEIAVTSNDSGFQVMQTTEEADPNVDYFPTGNRFLPPDTRAALIELTIEEAGLSDRVEVRYMPETYERRGFQGVVRAIREAHPGVPLHGLHGSDKGGFMVRAILDECGWIYPMRFLRRDGVSATAIRNGARGMTSDAVRSVLSQLAQNREFVHVRGRTYHNQQGLLVPAGGDHVRRPQDP